MRLSALSSRELQWELSVLYTWWVQMPGCTTDLVYRAAYSIPGQGCATLDSRVCLSTVIFGY